MAAITRASSSIAQSSEATQAALRQVGHDDDILSGSLSKHQGLHADLEATDKLIYRLKQQAAIDLRYRNAGLAVLALVIAFIVYERVFLNLGGALAIRSVAGVGSIVFCSVSTCTKPADDSTVIITDDTSPFSQLTTPGTLDSVEFDAATGDQIHIVPSPSSPDSQGSTAASDTAGAESLRDGAPGATTVGAEMAEPSGARAALAG